MGLLVSKATHKRKTGELVNVSVLTIVRGRRQQLENQFRGLLQSKTPPTEWIIVAMNEDIEDFVIDMHKSIATDLPFEMRVAQVEGDGEELPLAAARNKAAEVCRTEAMIFLDVDCIASPLMIETFVKALRNNERLWMGSPRYLPAHATTEAWNFQQLGRLAIRHPLQPELRQNDRLESSRYELFWSLCFAITKAQFNCIGGFDETFDGYGGEDTDFAFSARAGKVGFGFVDAVAYHQHHLVCKPPLNHFDAIVRNAKRFREKWNLWPMESWLTAFSKLGLVYFSLREDRLEILNRPTDEQVANARVNTPAGF